MVASRVAPSPPVTRLPTSTLRSEIRPETGERISVNCRFSSAMAAPARAACRSAAAWARAERRLSAASSLIALLATRRSARDSSRSDSDSRDCALATSARARASSAWNGR